MRRLTVRPFPSAPITPKRTNLGLVSLRQGDYGPRGWPEYGYGDSGRSRDYPDRSLRSRAGTAPTSPARPSCCTPSRGWAIRFTLSDMLPAVSSASRVLVECPPAMRTVLRGARASISCCREASPLPAFDVQVRRCRACPGCAARPWKRYPPRFPTCLPTPSGSISGRSGVARIPGFKIGVCWQGNPGHKNDRRRSVRLAQFAPLAAIPGVRLVSLQRGPAASSSPVWVGSLPSRLPPVQGEDPTADLMDAAAPPCALDLIVTVDTAAAHLAVAWAGVLVACWHSRRTCGWLLGRAAYSPWYPTFTLFHQTTPGQWTDVFERIAGEIRGLLTALAGRD